MDYFEIPITDLALELVDAWKVACENGDFVRRRESYDRQYQKDIYEMTCNVPSKGRLIVRIWDGRRDGSSKILIASSNYVFNISDETCTNLLNYYFNY